MTDLVIRAVLDATAVTAYAHRSVHVGEIIAEITDEGAGFAVPDLCLVEGAQHVDIDDWPALEVLAAHSQCVRLGLSTEWRDLAAAGRQLGGTARATAMLAAVDYQAYLLTAEPDEFGEDAPLVIGI